MKPGPRQRLVLEAVAEQYGFTVADLMIVGSRGPLGVARHASMAALYGTGRYSYPQLGQLYGVDHSTVVYGVQRHLERMGKVRTRGKVARRLRRRKSAARKRLIVQLTWFHGRDTARDIVAGRNPATQADLARWNALGQVIEAAA